jgi:hypothetical protein
VLSIDRQRIDRQSRGAPPYLLPETGDSSDDSENWIRLRSGLRKLEVQVCKFLPGLLDLFTYRGWHCGHAVLPLFVESGMHYRLCGSLNKREDYAELWIEIAESGEAVTEVVRVDLEDL